MIPPAAIAALASVVVSSGFLVAPAEVSNVIDASTTLPFGEYLVNQRTYGTTTQDLINRSIESCLAQSGYDIDLGRAPEPPDGEMLLARRYGLASPDDVGIVGYGGAPEAQYSIQDPGLNDPAVQALLYEGGERVEVSFEAAYGEPFVTIVQPGGCLGGAQAEIFGGFEHFAEFSRVLSQLDGLLNDTYTSTLASDDYAALAARWSTCMTASGFRFATPVDAQNADWRMGSNEPSELEILTAVADRDCRAESDYESGALEIEATFQAQRIEDYRLLMDDLDTVMNLLVR